MEGGLRVGGEVDTSWTPGEVVLMGGCFFGRGSMVCIYGVGAFVAETGAWPRTGSPFFLP